MKLNTFPAVISELQSWSQQGRRRRHVQRENPEERGRRYFRGGAANAERENLQGIGCTFDVRTQNGIETAWCNVSWMFDSPWSKSGFSLTYSEDHNCTDDSGKL